MIQKITSLNKDWVIEQYFETYSSKISYQQIFEEFKKYFLKEKGSYDLDHLESEIRHNCPQLLSKEEIYASSVSQGPKF